MKNLEIHFAKCFIMDEYNNLSKILLLFFYLKFVFVLKNDMKMEKVKSYIYLALHEAREQISFAIQTRNLFDKHFLERFHCVQGS